MKLARRNNAVAVNEPAFSSKPIHNQTFARWRQRVNEEDATRMFKGAAMAVTQDWTQPIEVRAPGYAGHLADSFLCVMGTVIPDNMIAIKARITYEPDSSVYLFDVPLLAYADEGKAVDVMTHEIDPSIRFLAAFYLYAYVVQGTLKPLPIPMYLTPTGIVGFCALHGVGIRAQ